jgi:hypothetical protein
LPDTILTAVDCKQAGISKDRAHRWRLDPRVFAREICSQTPDKWQDQYFAALAGVDDPKPGKAAMPLYDPSTEPMLGLQACKGPGKSFALAITAWWWMFTRWHCNGAAMSITGDNLRDNLWAEIARIREGAPILRQFFNQRGERLESKQYKDTWWISSRSFPQNADKTQQANTIAGLHGRHPIVICDEVGDYPDGVIVAAEAIFSSLKNKFDGRLVIVGNPTNTDGPLYRVTTRDRARWWVKNITGDPNDPNRSPRINKEWAQQQIDTWGAENPWVLVNVFGKFPPQGSRKLLGPEDVQAACARMPEPDYIHEAKIMGLDVARFGDNESVLFTRQGSMAWRPRVWRNLDLMTLADQVAGEVQTQRPDALFVDQAGIGGGIVDRLRQLGVNVIAVEFGGTPMDAKFKDRRSEMWWHLCEWVKKGGCIPDDIQLRSELVTPNYDYVLTNKATLFKLESKDQLKKRGVASPDRADALALTFAAPVHAPMSHSDFDATLEGALRFGKIRGGTEDDWDPFKDD